MPLYRRIKSLSKDVTTKQVTAEQFQPYKKPWPKGIKTWPEPKSSKTDHDAPSSQPPMYCIAISRGTFKPSGRIFRVYPNSWILYEGEWGPRIVGDNYFKSHYELIPKDIPDLVGFAKAILQLLDRESGGSAVSGMLSSRANVYGLMVDGIRHQSLQGSEEEKKKDEWNLRS